MKKRLTPKLINLLVTLICLFAGTTLKAQTVTGAAALYCKGVPISIAATTGAASYIWKRYDGQNTSGTATTITGQNAAVLAETAPTTPGFYTYQSIAVNANGCESAPSDPITIYVLPGITAAITSGYASDQLCTAIIPPTGTLTAQPGKAETVTETFAATDYSYQWYKNGTIIPTATDVTYTLGVADLATAGTNAYTVKINYKVHQCTENESAATNFTVTATPTKPVITIQ